MDDTIVSTTACRQPAGVALPMNSTVRISRRFNGAWRTALVVLSAAFLTACGGDTTTSPSEPSSPSSPTEPSAPSNPSNPAAPPSPAVAPPLGLSDLRIDTSFVGGATVEGVVTLTAPAPITGAVVTLTADSSSVRVPASVAIAAGDTSGKFQVATSTVTQTATVTLTARVGEATKTVTIELRVDPDTEKPTPPTPPTPPAPPAPPPPPTTSVISFKDIRVSGAVTRYSESGFTVEVKLAEWISSLTYGKPAPFIQFYSPAGVETVGELKITADGTRFWLTSVDVYSSTTPIPHFFEGALQGRFAYSFGGVVGNTFGDFATVTNPQANTPIDALIIRLTNPAAPCCRNPMGLDNIVLRR